MSRIRHLPLALLLLAVALVYANSLDNSFHFDDFHTIVENPAVRSLHNLPRIATDATAFSVLPLNRTWRPVVTASLAFDYALGHGYDVRWFHLSTLFWFLVLIGLLERLARLLFDRTAPAPANRWLALAVAAWFGLHPAMAETVNYIIQRGDLYCALGCIAALYLFARRPGWRASCLYLVPFALAMLSKPPALVFPLLLMLYIFFFESEGSAVARWKAAVRSTWPALLADAALLGLTSAMTPRSYTPTDLPAWSYRLTQPYVWLCYTAELFLPLHLNADTDLGRFTSLTGEALAGLAFAALLVSAIFLCGRRRRTYPIAFGLAWFLLTQLPTSLYALSEVENDHRMFFSFPGLIIAVVWSLHLAYGALAKRMKEAARHRLTGAITAAALLVLCGYAYGAHRRNEVWRSEGSLWADDVVKSPHNGRGLMMYGTTLLNRGQAGAALACFQRALAYTPNYPDLELNLGVASGELADQGDATLANVAEAHFRRALLLAPRDDRAHAFYARWLLAHGRLGEAAAQAQTAVALNPLRAMGSDLLLETEVEQGRIEDARAFAAETLRLLPDDAEAHTVLANGPGLRRMRRDGRLNASLASFRAGRYRQSIDEAQAALAFDPYSAEAWNNIGASDAALGLWDEAVAADRRALALNPNLVIARNNLAWAQQQRGLAASR